MSEKRNAKRWGQVPKYDILSKCCISVPQIFALLVKNLVLPVNEHLFAIIITQVFFRFPLLAAWHTSFACPKEVSRKRHPTVPALRASLCCSPVAGRQKLADAQTGLAPYSATSSAARRHRTGDIQYAHSCFRYALSG